MTANRKAILKTFSWRATASLDTLLIAYIITGSFDMAGAIMGIEICTKMLLYYIHERVWDGTRKIK